MLPTSSWAWPVEITGSGQRKLQWRRPPRLDTVQEKSPSADMATAKCKASSCNAPYSVAMPKRPILVMPQVLGVTSYQRCVKLLVRQAIGPNEPIENRHQPHQHAWNPPLDLIRDLGTDPPGQLPEVIP